MAGRQTKRKPAHKARPLKREELLPIAATVMRSISLRNHLSLAALKGGTGNIEAASELLKTIYWTFFIADQRMTKQHENHFMIAEKGVKACIVRGGANGLWLLDPDVAGDLQVILQLHDTQLSSMPVHLLEKAKARVTRLFDSIEGFPSFQIENFD